MLSLGLATEFGDEAQSAATYYMLTLAAIREAASASLPRN